MAAKSLATLETERNSPPSLELRLANCQAQLTAAVDHIIDLRGEIAKRDPHAPILSRPILPNGKTATACPDVPERQDQHALHR